VLILFLVFAIERKIVLVKNACSKYFIIIKFHDFHAALKGEITSFSLFIGFYRLHVFWPFFLFSLRWFWPSIFIEFFLPPWSKYVELNILYFEVWQHMGFFSEKSLKDVATTFFLSSNGKNSSPKTLI
jgi:hypothetical protein